MHSTYTNVRTFLETVLLVNLVHHFSSWRGWGLGTRLLLVCLEMLCIFSSFNFVLHAAMHSTHILTLWLYCAVQLSRPMQYFRLLDANIYRLLARPDSIQT